MKKLIWFVAHAACLGALALAPATLYPQPATGDATTPADTPEPPATGVPDALGETIAELRVLVAASQTIAESAEALAATRADAAAQLAELEQARARATTTADSIVAALDEAESLQQRLEKALDDFERARPGPAQPAPEAPTQAPAAAPPGPAAIAAAVLAGLAFLAASAALWVSLRHSRVTARAVSDVPDRLAHRLDPQKWLGPLRDDIAALRSTAASGSRAPFPPPDLSSHFTALGERLDRLEASLAQARAPEQPANDPGANLARVVSPTPTQGEAPADPPASAPTAVALDPATLPAAFSPTGRLASWRRDIEQQLAQERPQASTLADALQHWREAANTHDERRLVDATDAVGRALFAYLEATRGSDANAWIDAIQEWTKAFRISLEEAFPHCKLVAVYPQDRFDTDRMEAARGSSGGRVSVRKPLSWMIMEKTEAGERILRRAEVITA